MKEFFKIPNQDSAGFVKYRDFYTLLINSKRSGIQEDKFFDFLETIKSLDAIYKFRAFDDLVDSITNLGLLDKYFPHLKTYFLSILKVANKQSEDCYALYYLYRVAVKTRLMKEHFHFFLESIEKVVCPNMMYDVGLFDIAKAAYEAGVIEDYFPILLESFDKLESSRKRRAFAHLVETAKQTNLMNKYYLSLLERIDEIPEETKREAFNQLVDSLDSKLLKKKHPLIEKHLVSLLDGTEKSNPILGYRVFGSLFASFESFGLLEDHLLEFLEIIDRIEFNTKYNALYDLIKSIKNTELFDKWYLPIKKRFFFFLDDIEKFESVSKHDAFRALLKLEEGTGLIVENTPTYLELIKKLPPYSASNRYAYSKLLKRLKKSGLKQDHFPVFLEILDSYVIPSNYEAFCALLEAANANDLVKDNFYSLLERIKGFKYIYKYDAFHELIKTIKNTDLTIKYKTDILGTFQSNHILYPE